MSITDELRKYADEAINRQDYMAGLTYDLRRIADRIDERHEGECAESWMRGHDVWATVGNEDVMAEHGWVRGPLDADGKMWRSGDMSDSNWGVIEGIAYEDGRWLVSGHDTSAPWVPADSIRHHHEPTVEDVLREFSCVLMGKREFDGDVAEAISEYAAKLRELVWDLYECVSHANEQDWFYFEREKLGCGMCCTVNGEKCGLLVLADRMRELGIEAGI